MSTPLGPSTLLVTGLHPDTGETVVRAVWEHGDTLDDLLARHGWAPLSLDDVTGRSAPHEVEIWGSPQIVEGLLYAALGVRAVVS